VQDEVTLAPDRVRLTLGTKLERNDYTGWEVQPSARLAWTPTEHSTIWGAVSRAVRTPARIDRDFSLLVNPTTPVILGDDMQSEEVLAYEVGWRLEPSVRLSLSLSTFYNEYDDIRSAAPDSAPAPFPFRFKNGVRGHSEGVEVAGTYQVTERWRLKGGYTFLQKTLSVKPGSIDLNQASAESDDPPQQVLLQSSLDLPGRIEWDLVARYVDSLPQPAVKGYVGLDLRIGWRPTDRLQLAVVGQDLLDDQHTEFIPGASVRTIARGLYAMVTWR
jgi:iron complex outermembrane receptor protein